MPSKKSAESKGRSKKPSPNSTPEIDPAIEQATLLVNEIGLKAEPARTVLITLLARHPTWSAKRERYEADIVIPELPHLHMGIVGSIGEQYLVCLVRDPNETARKRMGTDNIPWVMTSDLTKKAALRKNLVTTDANVTVRTFEKWVTTIAVQINQAAEETTQWIIQDAQKKLNERTAQITRLLPDLPIDDIEIDLKTYRPSFTYRGISVDQGPWQNKNYGIGITVPGNMDPQLTVRLLNMLASAYEHMMRKHAAATAGATATAEPIDATEPMMVVCS